MITVLGGHRDRPACSYGGPLALNWCAWNHGGASCTLLQEPLLHFVVPTITYFPSKRRLSLATPFTYAPSTVDMCGIFGAVAVSPSSSSHSSGSIAGVKKDADLKERLSKRAVKALDYIKHRGPDGNRTWVSEDCRVGRCASSPRINKS